MIKLNSNGGRIPPTFPTVQWGHGFGLSLEPPQIIELYLWTHDEKTTSHLQWLVCSKKYSWSKCGACLQRQPWTRTSDDWTLKVSVKYQQLGGGRRFPFCVITCIKPRPNRAGWTEICVDNHWLIYEWVVSGKCFISTSFLSLWQTCKEKSSRFFRFLGYVNF